MEKSAASMLTGSPNGFDDGKTVIKVEILSKPNACMECGRFQGCKLWAAPPEKHQKENIPATQRPILIVTSGPTPDGEWMPESTLGGAFLRAFLNAIEIPWHITGSVLCHPHGQLTKPSDQEIKLCANRFLLQTIQKLDPAGIVALGVEAVKAVLGGQTPKSLKSARRDLFMMPDSDRWILVGQSPLAHKPKENELWEEYQELFSRAEHLALHGISDLPIDWVEISDPREAYLACQSVPRDHSFDTEYDANENDPVRRTRWHPGATLLCLATTWWDEPTQKRKSLLLAPPAVSDPRVLQALFKDSRPSAHNGKSDIQDLYALAGYNIFEDIRRLETGEIDFDDTIVKLYMPNQSKSGNALNLVAVRTWGVADWKLPIVKGLAATNAKITEVRKERKNIMKRLGRFKHYEELANEGDKRALAWIRRETRKPSLEEFETKQQLAQMGDPKALKWLTNQAKKTTPSELRHKLQYLLPPERPLQSAGFGDIPKRGEGGLYPYCVKDSFIGDRIRRELIPQIEKQHGIEPNNTAYRLMLRIIEATCMVERCGLPVDKERLDASFIALDAAEKKAREALIAQEKVVRAVGRTIAWKKSKKDGKAFAKALNPQATNFLLELARETGDYHSLPLTKRTKKGGGGNPSVNKLVLAQLAGSGTPWDRLNPDQKVWHVVRQLKSTVDLRSKLGFLRWTVNGRVHTDYKVVRVEKSGAFLGSESAGGAKTGRLASVNPNLQNIKKDKAMRSLFVAPPGWIFLELDYDRIEPVVLAVVAGVKGWERIFNDELDIYQVIANEACHLGIDMSGTPEQVRARLSAHPLLDPDDKESLRNQMKTRLLAIMYDESAKSFARKSGLALEDVQKFYRDFYRAYPEIWEYKKETHRKMLGRETFVTPFGRRKIPDLPYKHDPDYEALLGAVFRQYLNIPIQSTAADITAWKVWEVLRMLVADGRWMKDVEIGNLVHDSSWSLVREEAFEAYARDNIRVMEDMSTLPFWFGLPGSSKRMKLKCSLKAGYTLADMKDVDKFNPQIPAACRRAA